MSTNNDDLLTHGLATCITCNGPVRPTRGQTSKVTLTASWIVSPDGHWIQAGRDTGVCGACNTAFDEP